MNHHPRPTSRVGTTGWLSCLLVLLSFSCGEQPPMPPEPTELEGTWIGTVLEARPGEWTLIVAGDELYLKGSGTNQWLRGSFQLDTTAEPKHLTVTIRECDCPDVGKVAPAIYQLRDEILTVAGVQPGRQSRPTSFRTGSGVRVLRFRRYASGP